MNARVRPQALCLTFRFSISISNLLVLFHACSTILNTPTPNTLHDSSFPELEQPLALTQPYPNLLQSARIVLWERLVRALVVPLICPADALKSLYYTTTKRKVDDDWAPGCCRPPSPLVLTSTSFLYNPWG